MSFISRASFIYPQRTPSWFAGHMARSMREMGDLLKDIDMVIETRDARLPLTSINGAFDRILEKAWGPRVRVLSAGGSSGSSSEMGSGIGNGSGSGIGNGSGSGNENLNGSGSGYNVKGKAKEKMVVYTKRDLAEERFEGPLIKAFREHLDQNVVFADTRSDPDVKAVLQHAARIAKQNEEFQTEMRILVVGMPNVGKSSLLNALRRVGVHKGKHFQTGAMAGVTRKLTGTCKIYEDPPIYVYDAPGVMVPFLGHGELGAERGLKYALTGGIKEDLFELDAVVDYLLWKMNTRLVAQQHLPPDDPLRQPSYLTTLPVSPPLVDHTDSLIQLLDALCSHIGALKKGGQKDHDAGMAFIMRSLRDGKLGRWTFDDFITYPRQPTTNIGGLLSGPELDQAVSQSVKKYLELMDSQYLATREGKDLSSNQQRKKEVKERKEKSLAKWIAKTGGTGRVGGGGGGGSKGGGRSVRSLKGRARRR